MTIKEDYEQYIDRAKTHLKVAQKNNIPYDMDWLMFFEYNYEQFYSSENLDMFLESNDIKSHYDFVDIRKCSDYIQLFYGNKLPDIDIEQTQSSYLKNITFNLFGGRKDCFWTKPQVDEELFVDYLNGEFTEKQFIKITMRNQQKCRS